MGRPITRMKRAYFNQPREEFDALCAKYRKQGYGDKVDLVMQWLKDGSPCRASQTIRKTIPNTRTTYETPFHAVPAQNISDADQLILKKIEEAKVKIKQKSHEPHVPLDQLKTYYMLLKKLENERIQVLYKNDFKAFDDRFFQEIQDRAPTPFFHFEMFNLYNVSKRCCVVCPRGHAKTMTARRLILHRILHGLVSYVIIVGASEDMAGENLRWIRDQLTDNDEIKKVYGNLKDPNKWSDTMFNTSTGVRVKAIGAGQKIRGRNEKGRPDLIYIDDLEDDEGVLNKDQRSKLTKWFEKALLPARSKHGQIIITGTILHPDSLLRNILLNKVRDHIPWDILFYQAIIDEGAPTERALWPEMHPMSELVSLREKDPATFYQEYQNDPRAGNMAVFKQEEYQHIDKLPFTLQFDPVAKAYYMIDRTEIGKVMRYRLNIQLNTDHAISERTGADYTVLMITGMDCRSRLFVLEYAHFRSSDIKAIIDDTFRLIMKYIGRVMTCEMKLIQKVLKKPLLREMAERDYFFQIKEISKDEGSKLMRIRGLKSPIASHLVFWYSYMTELEEELSQVTATALGVHDDIIDALADAYQSQIEALPEDAVNDVKVNTLEWMIQQGLLPTVTEEDEILRYG